MAPIMYDLLFRFLYRVLARNKNWMGCQEAANCQCLLWSKTPVLLIQLYFYFTNWMRSLWKTMWNCFGCHTQIFFCYHHWTTGLKLFLYLYEINKWRFHFTLMIKKICFAVSRALAWLGVRRIGMKLVLVLGRTSLSMMAGANIGEWK